MAKETKIEIARTNTRARFEHWAKNPQCKASTVSAVLDVNVTKVAVALGYEPKNMKSEIAIQRGMLFEQSLCKDDAKVLREALQRKHFLAIEVDYKITSNANQLELDIPFKLRDDGAHQGD